MEYNGELVHIGAVEQITDTFRKRMIVVLNNSGKYANEVSFELVQDNVRIADELRIGDLVDVVFDVRGRGFKRKDGTQGWMNSLQAWRVTKHATQPQPNPYPHFDNAPF
jgi:hypothetical protein